MAIAEDRVPSTGEEDPYMHVFLDTGKGSSIAFFELPNSQPMGRDENTPEWVQHIAFKLDDMNELERMHANLEDRQIDVLGPIDHGIFDSIYFFDPNGHRLEFAVNKGSEAQLRSLSDVALDMLEEWDQTRRAPKHADWLHKR